MLGTIKVVTKEEVIKLSKKAKFQSTDILDENLALVRMRKITVELNNRRKPNKTK